MNSNTHILVSDPHHHQQHHHRRGHHHHRRQHHRHDGGDNDDAKHDGLMGMRMTCKWLKIRMNAATVVADAHHRADVWLTALSTATVLLKTLLK